MPKKKTGQRKKAEKQKARQKEIGSKSKYPKYRTSYNIRQERCKQDTILILVIFKEKTRTIREIHLTNVFSYRKY